MLCLTVNACEQANQVTKGTIYTYVDKLVLWWLETPEEAIELCAFLENWWCELMEVVHDALRDQLVKVKGRNGK